MSLITVEAVMNSTEHWDGVWSSKKPDEVSWFEPEPAT